MQDIWNLNILWEINMTVENGMLSHTTFQIGDPMTMLFHEIVH